MKIAPPKTNTGLWFQILFMFTRIPGEMIQFDQALAHSSTFRASTEFRPNCTGAGPGSPKKTTQSHSFQQIAGLSKVWIKPQLRPYWRAGIGVGGPLRFSLHEGWIQSLAGCLSFFLQIIGLGKFFGKEKFTWNYELFVSKKLQVIR